MKAIALVTLVSLGACSSVTSSRTQSTVTFTIDAPLCSSRIPVTFSIDGVDVGKDTFLVHLAPEHTSSRAFATTPGSHTLAARADHGYVWPSATVTLTAGQAFTDSLPFYCS